MGEAKRRKALGLDAYRISKASAIADKCPVCGAAMMRKPCVRNLPPHDPEQSWFVACQSDTCGYSWDEELIEKFRVSGLPFSVFWEQEADK